MMLFITTVISTCLSVLRWSGLLIVRLMKWCLCFIRIREVEQLRGCGSPGWSVVTLSVCPTPPVPHLTVGWWVTRVVSGHPLLCAPHPQSLTSLWGGGSPGWSVVTLSVCPTPPVPHLTAGWWVTRVVSGHPLLCAPHPQSLTSLWGGGSPGWSVVTLSVCPTPPVPHLTVGWWVTRVVSGHPLCVPHTPSPSPHCGVVGHQGGQWSPSLCAPHPQSLTSLWGGGSPGWSVVTLSVCPTPPVPHLTVGWWVTRLVSGHPLCVPHTPSPSPHCRVVGHQGGQWSPSLCAPHPQSLISLWGGGSPGWSVVTLSCVPHGSHPTPVWGCGSPGWPVVTLSVPTPPVPHLSVGLWVTLSVYPTAHRPTPHLSVGLWVTRVVTLSLYPRPQSVTSMWWGLAACPQQGSTPCLCLPHTVPHSRWLVAHTMAWRLDGLWQMQSVCGDSLRYHSVLFTSLFPARLCWIHKMDARVLSISIIRGTGSSAIANLACVHRRPIAVIPSSRLCHRRCVIVGPLLWLH